WLIMLGGTLISLMALSRSGSTFFWRTQDRIEPAAAADKGALLALIGLLACVVALSLCADPVLDYTQRVAGQLRAPELYLQAMHHFRVR
ncbi:MAG TPA: monovalent cation/H+ antiporter subunit D, partial [Cellvibrio sp.]|nr:monovalent cation/H+ antiporter subunit D [Cellvibrio sp.]